MRFARPRIEHQSAGDEAAQSQRYDLLHDYVLSFEDKLYLIFHSTMMSIYQNKW